MLGVPDAVHRQVLQYGQAARLAKQAHRRVGMHARRFGDRGHIDIAGVVTRDEDGHPLEFSELPLHGLACGPRNRCRLS